MVTAGSRRGLAAVIAVLSVGTAACGDGSADYALPAALRPPCPATAPFGVSSIATLTDRTLAGYRREDAAIRATGATWIRIVINWNETESADGSFAWERIDDAISAARADGLSVLGLISGPAPAWAGVPPFDGGSPPQDASAFADFAGLLAHRYSTSVAAWEIWNEPNLRGYWHPPDPSAYLAALRGAYTAIKSVTPAATVVLGGLSPDVSGIDIATYLEGVYAAGGGRYFDAVGVHPYVVPSPLGTDPFGAMDAVEQARAVMDRHGESRKQIWVTEWGEPTGTAYYAVREERQADIVLAGLHRLQHERAMGPVFLFTTKDWSRDSSDADFNFGLYRYDYSAKPVVDRLRRRCGPWDDGAEALSAGPTATR